MLEEHHTRVGPLIDHTAAEVSYFGEAHWEAEEEAIAVLDAQQRCTQPAAAGLADFGSRPEVDGPSLVLAMKVA